MDKSLERVKYEVQHARFTQVLAECLMEMSEEETVGQAETWADVLAGDFLQKCTDLKVPYKHQFVAVAMLVMALMTAYDKAPVDLESAPVKSVKPS